MTSLDETSEVERQREDSYVESSLFVAPDDFAPGMAVVFALERGLGAQVGGGDCSTAVGAEDCGGYDGTVACRAVRGS
jgi:hypothetical protein